MWSPKRMTLLWFSGVCEGYPCPDCFFFLWLHLFNHGLIKARDGFQISEVSAGFGFCG